MIADSRIAGSQNKGATPETGLLLFRELVNMTNIMSTVSNKHKISVVRRKRNLVHTMSEEYENR